MLHIINTLRFCIAAVAGATLSEMHATYLVIAFLYVCLSFLYSFLAPGQVKSKLDWKWQMGISRKGWSLGIVNQ